MINVFFKLAFKLVCQTGFATIYTHSAKYLTFDTRCSNEEIMALLPFTNKDKKIS